MGIIGQNNFRTRRWFGRITKNIENVPDLLSVQKKSYREFIQKDVPPSEREDIGLQRAFNSIFPITSSNNNVEISFKGYSLGEPKYDVYESKLRGVSYSLPLKVKVELTSYDVDPLTGERKSFNDVREQEVHFGEIPYMTKWGTFIINGTERVIVNQLHRSPGTFFDYDKSKSSSGNEIFKSRLIPYHGSWLDFEFDAKRILYVKIDRKKKIPATIFLKAWGYTTEEILKNYYFGERILFKDGLFLKHIDFSNTANLEKQKIPVDVYDDSGKLLAKEGKRFSKGIIRRLEKFGISEIAISPDYLVGKRFFSELTDPVTGEVIANINDEINTTLLEEITNKKIPEFELIYMENMNYSPFLSTTLKVDKVNSKEEALMEIYRVMQPSNPVNPEVAEKYFKLLFLNKESYDLTAVGRLRMNHKFNENVPLEDIFLRKEDVMNTVMYLLNLADGRGQIDDIDHMGNRRVRLVGELLEDTFKTGLLRMAHNIKEKLAGAVVEALTPYEVINYKQVMAVIKEFFAGGQLSQFMDQTNILSEMTHKRRLSALGPGGLAREHAGFEVRDVHRTHYGRVCPIETPEGPNVGLIVSLATFSKTNKYGYIETPFRVVKDAVVTDEIIFLDAIDEEGQITVPSSVTLDENNKIIDEIVKARVHGEVEMVSRERVTLMDLVPLQLVSVSASLIPFLEHDDANRALMGSNMQRQAVPLIITDAPFVGTGMEKYVARDSQYAIFAKRSGVVDKVDATRIVVLVDDDDENATNIDVDIYNMHKYQLSNQNTSINQKPIVRVGDRVNVGDVMADGPAMDRGELALGKNALIAFMPWNGYNYEDSVLINSRLLREDTYTSIHIEELVCDARETKRGPEEITADIPNAPEDVLRKLDDSGIIRIGQKIKAGDILVGKVTPKGETVLSPEEKLLRAIFGEKAGDVKDSSLYVAPGVEGVVIDTRIFAKKGVKKDSRMKEQEQLQIEAIKRNKDDEIRIIESHSYAKVRKLLLGKISDIELQKEDGTLLIKEGDKLTMKVLKQVPDRYLAVLSVESKSTMQEVKELLLSVRRKLDLVKKLYDSKIKQISKNDDLTPGVIKSVKVFIAIKRKLSVGDKMSGRHGNKGVVSMLLPEEDVPFMEDGRTVDIVLNPLGVPSRMNIGQILEVHLGLAARKLGEQIDAYVKQNYGIDKLKSELKTILDASDNIAKLIDEADEDDIKSLIKSIKKGIYTATPVFDGADETEIQDLLRYSGQKDNGKMILFDGRTGEPFASDVTVGIMYFLKLHHLVDEKVHARSTGHYSLVTQQPLGGKAQFGGQRLGEMEVWALEAYGAAYALQEFLTVKSDDVEGRKKLYEAIVRGKNKYEMGIPASFSVLVKEMQSLCLDVNMIEANNQK
jgi:DNA-directed RNA polymerase subunit beta